MFGAQVTESSAAFEAHYKEASWEAEKPRLKTSTLIGDTVVSSSSLPCYATKLAYKKVKYYLVNSILYQSQLYRNQMFKSK